MLSVPIIMTDLPVLKELNIINGVHGFLLDLDMKNVPVDKIYKGLPKFKYEPPKSNWDKYLKGKSKYNPNEEIEVYSFKTYDDIETGLHHTKGDIFKDKKWRVNYLEAEKVVYSALTRVMREKVSVNDIKNTIKTVCSDFLYDRTQRSPIIIPVILVKRD